MRPPVLAEPRMVDSSLHPGAAEGKRGASGNEGGAQHLEHPRSTASGALEGRARRALMVRPVGPREKEERPFQARIDPAGGGQSSRTAVQNLEGGRMLTF